MESTFDFVIAGAGVFGLTAALSLRDRGHEVLVVDPGPIPHPLAASTDISKVVRMEYGADEQYMEMVEESLPIWRDWNLEFGETLFHETGICILTRSEMAPGGFEFESYQTLRRRGHSPERLDRASIAQRFPAWSGDYVDGFYHRNGGFAESGRVITSLAEVARRKGVSFLVGDQIEQIETDGARLTAVRTSRHQRVVCGRTVVAAGAWTRYLVPELAPATRVSGHPVFHLRPSDPDRFRGERFPTFMADVSRTGWYGFPLHPRDRVVKVANHGIGIEQHPDAERVVTKKDESELREFLRTTFADLADAQLVYTRRCLYCDTLDGHLWIDRHPTIDGLSVATGGSGHGFKLAPILGDLIADSVEGKSNRWLPKFAWRDLEEGALGQEASRYKE